MADQDLNINVRTTADTSGIEEIAAKLKSLEADQARISALPGKGFPTAGGIGPVPPELLGDVKAATVETEKLGAANLLAGANLGKARQEAIVLARELQTGGNVTRTLGSLLGALGPEIAIGAIAAYSLGKGIQGILEHQLKINQALNVQSQKLTESAQKWAEMARGAETTEDVLKVAQGTMGTLVQAQQKFLDFQNAGTSAWGDTIDQILNAIGYIGIFGDKFTKDASKLADEVERIQKVQANTIKDAQGYRDLFERRRAEPIDQAVKDVTAALSDLEKQRAAALGPNGEVIDAASFIAASQGIERNKQQLSELIKLYGQLKRASDEATKPLAKALTTPTGTFVNEQIKAEQEHQAKLAALEEKRREAEATGDTDRLKAIEDELAHDTFARDQRKEALQRYIANQKSLLGPEGATQQNLLKQLGTVGAQKFESAQAELEQMYAQQKLGRPETRAESAERQREERVDIAKRSAAESERLALEAQKQRILESSSVQEGYVKPEEATQQIDKRLSELKEKQTTDPRTPGDRETHRLLQSLVDFFK